MAAPQVLLDVGGGAYSWRSRRAVTPLRLLTSLESATLGG